MELYSYFNFLEALFWISIGCVFAFRALFFKTTPTKLYLISAVNFLLFGCSDFVEIQTGTWYKPWWLLLWKSICILGFVFIYAWYRKVNIKNEQRQ